MRTSGKNRVLILGGGHAGIRVADRLLKTRRPDDNLEVAVVDTSNVEVYHGLMPQMIAGLVQPQHALVPLRQVLPGVTLYTYEVEHINLPNRRVHLSRGDEREAVVLDFDYLVLTLGSVTDLSRFPGMLEHGLQTKTIGDIFHLRNHLIDMLERASVEQDPEERRSMLTFVVAGAGFAGIEVGVQSYDMIEGSLGFYPSIDRSEIRFVMLSSSPRILPALSDALAERAVRYIERRGIDLKRGVGLAEATANVAVLTNGERVPTRTIIVTVGIGTNPVIAELPVELTRGRVACDQYCRVLDWPGVFAAGDNAAVPDLETGDFFRPTGFIAATQSLCAADNVLATIRGQRLRSYQRLRYQYFRGMEAALLSRWYALWQIRGLELDGAFGALLWRIVILPFIQTWDRRVALVQDWIVSSIFPRDIAQLRVSRSDTIVPMRFGAGEVIVREGDPGSRFYVITDGEVEVVCRTDNGGEEQLARLGPGQFFGEIALLHDTRRNATVRAASDTKVLSIAQQDFSTLVKDLPVLHDTVDQTGRRRAEERSALA